MKYIVAGGRDFDDWIRLRDALCLLLRPGDTVISGTAAGADRLGEKWATAQKELVSLDRMPAEWDKYGKRAGYVRNAAMAAKADGVIVFWDGKSQGTRHMIDIAMRIGIDLHIYRY